MDISLTFSVCFLTVCAISLIFGSYVLFNDLKSALNRTFSVLCFALSIWAFGFSIAISAPDAQTCLFWRRFSSLGWGTMFSFMLHFFLILTEKKRLLQSFWIYPLLYAPAVLSLSAFTFPLGIHPTPYQLVKTPLGWINIAQNNAWDWFYIIYYASFMLIGFGVLVHRYKNVSSPKVKKQMLLILSSFVSILLIGTLTDIVSNSFLSITIPQIAPILMLFPVGIVYYTIRQYGLMKGAAVNEDELILKQAERYRIFNYLSIVTICGGFLNFISQYVLIDQPDLKTVVFLSAFMILSGQLFQVLQRLKISNEFKDTLTVVWISVAIPLFTLQYAEYASLTIWAFPIIFIVIALLFNKRILLIAVSLSTLATQLTVWILLPSTTVIIDEANYIGRIGIFGIAIYLAFYVHRIYTQRLKENAYQISFQKMVAKFSTDFLTVNEFNLSDKVNAMLAESGVFFGIDRTCVYLVDRDSHSICITQDWTKSEYETKAEEAVCIDLDQFPWLLNQINANKVVHVPNVDKLDEAAAKELQQLGEHNLKSLVSIPLVCKGDVLGFMGLASMHKERAWLEDQLSLLRILANILADALAKVNAEKEINQMAFYDHLTKLPNRALFKDRVKQAIELSRRTEKLLGIFFVDLDSFKTVNDTMGHEGGDELLIRLAQEFTRRIRKSDTVSRFAGDEFLFLLSNLSHEDDIIRLADSIMDIFNKPVVLKGQEFFVTASAGIAVFPTDGEDTNTLIKHADIAMYNAKEKGKSQYVLCSSDMKGTAQVKLRLSNSLYRALDRGELLLHYQPQVSLETEAIVGVEALLRWQHLEMGNIPPSIFIPLAEQTGLINPIGEWVLRTACRQNKDWQDSGLPPMRMAVNVSINQFRNPDFVNQVQKVLEETGLQPAYLELEITESIASNEVNNIIRILSNFKQLGVSISIDDFGTEYSSLSRLKLLPIDRIKMDMQFVRGIEGNDKDRAIAKVIINLAKNLGIKVIAEGVETEVQLDFLKQWMCDEVQGYHYYKPMPAEELQSRLMRSHNAIA